jgi:thiol:disulfide interchange protein
VTPVAVVGLAVALAACSAERAVPTVVIPGGASPPAVELSAEPSTAAAPGHAPRAARPIAWEASEPAARERARRVGLPLIVWVRADWDAATLEMERMVWEDPGVRGAARPFVALRLDVTDAEGDAERYAERYGLVGMPATILFDARGQRVAAFFGFRDAPTIAEALRRASE